MTKIEFYKHSLAEQDMALASQVMQSTFLTTGPMVARFERKFADYMGIQEAVALTSCTGAMHLSLLRHGIGPGDEVITTPMTFAATATAIIQTGARPIFVDVCPKSGLLLPEAVEIAITDKTKAILVVHLYGRMVDMQGFSDLAKKHKIALIEDAAHCIEGIRNGVRPGQLSDTACFSFYATKSMTCGEGGALICKSSEDADWYRSARHHGISKNASSRYVRKYEHWDMEMMGWKYNMDDIQAAILINQVDRLNKNNQRRQLLESLYRELLSDIDGLDFIEPSEPGEISGHHLFTVLLPNNVSRDAIIEKLQENSVGCAVNYRAVHTLTYFRETFGYRPEDFPTANEIGNKTITLPLYPKLSEDEVKAVCRYLKKEIEIYLTEEINKNG
ncbi:MAG: DegT/DnrJ/EryC1/StrS family aminotransferase [Desulfobacteraceae bacterium]|nr:DegT/DnrJ/EryC1/StrS family aminotransferase [Desulfobacteraceae bacterium]